MDVTPPLLLLLLGLALLALATAVLRPRSTDAGRPAERERLETEVSGVRGELAAVRGELASSRAETATARAETAAATERAAGARAEAAAARAALAAEQSSAAEKLELLRRSEETLKEQFQALSAQALEQSGKQFLELAGQTLRQATTRAEGDLEQRRQAVAHLVAPLGAKLTELEQHLRTVEGHRTDAYAGLRQQVEAMRLTSDQLRSETTALVTALRAPQTRGRWGEVQLRRVVESAGMLEHCDFAEQQSVRSDDGGVLRPDLVVRLAGGKSVVVDSKVPFSAYLEAMEARDDATRDARRKAHARHFRDHVTQLSAKDYWSRFDASPEFVVMFVPADAFLDAALQEDPTLLEAAFAENVVLATPSTLMALLRTVAYTWRQETVAAGAREVSRLGRELHDRLSAMGSHVDKLGRSLGGAVDAYNKTVGSLETRVLVTARRFQELGVVEAELAVPRSVESTPRTLSAPELVTSVEQSRPVVSLPAPPQQHTAPAGAGGTLELALDEPLGVASGS